MTEILTADNLATLSGVKHAFFTRAYGNGGFYLQKNPEDVLKTRTKMAAYLHVAPQKFLSCYQHHSTDVVTITEQWSPNERPKADALVTDKPGFALGVLTADCVPILFAHKSGRIIGAAHAGWRGALNGIIENTLTAMEKLGAPRGSVYAALGPCIWPTSYEVGPEFPAPFLAENPEHTRFFKPAFRSDHYYFDLAAYVVAKLHHLGVVSVQASGADTCADPERFYSHRYSTLHGEKRAGNLMSAIAFT